ncbi:similar to Uncharacterized conserved protein [Thermobifida fusca YX]|uniref:GmrSD restriction endonucleases N-terminal domain-containing protein n=4 Tax=Thermobifida fusca TaxID=2021 RepID=A0A9P2TEC7_THEFU|nr:DUF262 domain-containing protein [Thermobifida fusca]AAZ54103.1 similar to Uncharacterized conserved protein [Thermobifida fusca YX]EOR72921.1 hypothetical protein TM51_00635 [Thermobifida fusca TM51]PZN62526.1 MAG: DUF262 domain-containing protein [Thermobifida fusca]
MAKLSTLLDQIDSGTILLPEFQRGYVWNRDQVRGLMRSLYRGYPVGSLLLWETAATDVAARGGTVGDGRTHLMLLDGQQRITSLYGVIRGRPPAFFEGDAKAFTGLYFHVEDEVFEFYSRSKMASDPRWVNVTELFQQGPVPYLARFTDAPSELATIYLQRLNRLHQVTEREFPQEKITGADKEIDEVVDIFNRVNSSGTKLSKGDLALAKLCAQWMEARSKMREALRRWERAGYRFDLDWLLRTVTAVATGRSQFEALERLKASEFKAALEKTVAHVDTFLNTVSGRLGLDHDRVLPGRYSIMVVVRLLELNNGSFTDGVHRDKTLYWYIHSALWGRYYGSAESNLQQDLETLAREGIDGLISSLERVRGGSLTIRPHDFEGATKGSRFYPVLYMLSRVKGARDFGTGLELKAETLGKFSSLEIHHVFPKPLLYNGYDRKHVNAIANFCFLTPQSKLEIGNRSPEEYLPEVEARHPGVLASQWIPTDPALWKLERYRDFLFARRELLAEAAQSFLEELRSGTASANETVLRPISVVTEKSDDARAVQVRELIEELQRMGYSEPLVDTEVPDPETGRAIAVAEAFWPEGLQAGQGAPVVLELDPGEADLPRLKELGYEVFTSVDALLGYVKRRNADAAGERLIEPETVAAEPREENEPLLRELGLALRSLYDRARDEAGYTPSQLLSMIADLGPLGAARRLLHAPTVSDGFSALWERGRLDLTVEAVVCEPRFAPLFTEEELETARRRLNQFGYSVDSAA